MKKLSISAREYWARTLKLFQGGEKSSSSGKGGVVADLQVLIDSRLESALHCPSTPPVAVIVMGPIAAGKTTHRKTRLGSGYVHIDSADIFHELSRGDATFDFPDAFASEIEHIGRALTKAAIGQKLSVVVETPGHDQDELITLINSLKKVGYQVEVQALATDRDSCEAQHANRGDSVSSYWAAPIHVNWVVQECLAQAAA
ncbi:zeta toxin family protein [Variovorax paradoxus]|uniref:zeta toxin family protein n=1 Tax=Variovorax paradoxus TaxID=34073 RepID=UPI003D64A6F7